MKKEKYFIPEIEDIYSGYEYEVKRFNGDWGKVTEFSNDYVYEDNPHYAIMKDIKAGKIRVPYLSKEQIEKNLEMSGISYIFDSNKCILKLYDDKNTYFYGLCKSVNELKPLLECIKYAI